MTTPRVPSAGLVGAWIALLIRGTLAGDDALPSPAFRVRPGQSIQQALDLAAANPTNKHVIVETGTYRPAAKGQAFLWFNHRHDGVVLEAEGDVTLTAANPDLADREAASYPAVVNHVVYFGDGISRRTVLRGFKITGANNFVTDTPSPVPIEPRFNEFRSTEGTYGSLFFYSDGGGIKVFGRSYPTLERLVVHDNFASPCGAGISIEHRGFQEGAVVIRDCIFRNNRALVTGPAVDLLPGSSANLTNCLFVGNLSNRGDKHVPVKGNIDWPKIPELIRSAAGYLGVHGSGALTVFTFSSVNVERCTFTANSNGVDDRGQTNAYRNCLFWNNTAPGSARTGGRYELDIARATNVVNCHIQGSIPDLRKTIDPRRNTIGCEDPKFDDAFRPTNPTFEKVGYRPS
jgi:hypothetical protein